MADQQPGNGSPNPPPGTGAPSALDEEAVTRIASQVVNNAWTARSKKLRDDLTADFTKGFDGIARKLEEMSAAPPIKEGKSKSKGEEEASPEYKGLQRQLAEQKAEHDKLLAKLAEAEQKQKTAALRQNVIKGLTENGLTETRRVEMAADIIFAKGLAKYDEDDRPVFVENSDSVIDLASGLKAWAKSEDAKIFLPPSGARGSGDRPGQGGPKPAPNAQQDVSATDLGLALVGAFGGVSVGT